VNIVLSSVPVVSHPTTSSQVCEQEGVGVAATQNSLQELNVAVSHSDEGSPGPSGMPVGKLGLFGSFESHQFRPISS